MEQLFYLDVNSEVDLYCLHLLYLPTINTHLEKFRNAYLNHKIRTAGNQTPMQLWLLGNLSNPELSDLNQMVIIYNNHVLKFKLKKIDI